MGLARELLLWGSRNRWLERQIRRRAFARRAVRRFMPGETLEAALGAASDVAGRGMGVVLTQLGENVSTVEDAATVRDHYVDVLEQIATRDLPVEVSVKLTQLGLDVDRDRCLAHLVDLAGRIRTSDRFWIDMEDSSYTDVTLELFREIQASHPRVGVCLQAYLRRTAADLEVLLPRNPHIRVVKGAYNEASDVAYPRKRDVDDSFEALGRRLIDHAADADGCPPVLGTHDLRLVERLQRYAADRGLPPDASEVHMLYGIRSAEQRHLAAGGHRVRVLISYGSAWFPWYMRRLAERPANVWFVARSVFAT